MSPPNDHLRKRQRIPVSCSVCRKRKSKCDRVKPICGTCKKKSISHLCQYEGSPWINDNSVYVGERSEIPGTQKLNFNQKGHLNHNNQENMAATTIADIRNQKIVENSFMGKESGKALKNESYMSDVRSQLQMLKDKVQQLEQTMDSPTPNSVAHSTDIQASASNHLNGNYSHQGHPNSIPEASFHLPPIDSMGSHNDKRQEKLSMSLNNRSFEGSISSNSNQNYQGFTPQNPNVFQNQKLGLNVHASTPSTTLNDIDNIHIDENETIDFYKNSTSLQIKRTRWENHGTMAFTGLSKKDPFLRIFRVYGLTVSKNSKLSDISKLSNSEFGVANSLLINNIKKKGSSKKDNIGFSLANTDKKGYQEQTIELILKALPNRRVIWLLFYRFFKHVYPIIPIIDENTLIAEAKVIFSSFNYKEEKCEHINIDSKLDFATIAIILIVLRFGYLSLTTTNAENQREYTKDEKYLLNHPIKSEVITIAQRCISNLNFLRKSSFKLLQAMLLLRYYFMYAPEDCDGVSGGNSTILLSTIVQHAISIGLNRDPESFPYIKSVDLGMTQLWRKIWYCIVLQDISQSIKHGSTLNIVDYDMFDTKLPNYKVDLVEQEINRSIKNLFELCLKLKEISFMVTKAKNHAKIKDLIVSICGIESSLDDPIYDIHTLLMPVNSIDVSEANRKIRGLQWYLHIKMCLFSFYFSLWIHYEECGNFINAIYFMKKSFSISTEMINISAEVFRYGRSYFGTGSELMLTPILQSCMMKASIAHTGILIRCIHAKKLTNNDPRRSMFYEAVSTLYELSLSNSLALSEHFVKLGDYYSNSYKLFHTMSFFSRLLNEDPESFADFLSDPNACLYKADVVRHVSLPDKNCLMYCSSETISTLLDICSRIDISGKTIILDGIPGSAVSYESPAQLDLNRSLTNEEFAKLCGALGDYDCLDMPDLDNWLGI